MLNFLPDSMLYGQKPQVWWTKKHDIDLLRGIYKYGYANYQTIRNAPEFSFRDLEKSLFCETIIISFKIILFLFIS